MPELSDSSAEEKLQVPSTRDLITERIRALIHSGKLRPGDMVSIDELAKRFGISRTPVRDAMWVLSNEGLVRIRPRVGVLVRRISAREVLEVYAIKGALEPLMASWAAERGSVQVKRRLVESLDQLTAAAESKAVEQYVELVEERRNLLLDMAGSDVLRDALNVSNGRVRLLRYRNLSQPGQLERSVAEHAGIARAVADGDGDLAYRLMEEHMKGARDGARHLLEMHPDDYPEDDG